MNVWVLLKTNGAIIDELYLYDSKEKAQSKYNEINDIDNWIIDEIEVR